ncbi:LytR/AlgR family response regulator transcription factor [Clostridium aminobutyricum]|uniref:Stage 0 sporulation protein A homolog n=1 Tax=Clostridium aminobutyricum TaxID=33953 RepID=A0A939D6H2_CLOAM|nr:response regulator [Clostridium aminobutyricum]MBN7771950.1 response regulator [Clostridium aminobutyricum]
MVIILVVEDSENDILLYKNVFQKLEGVQVLYALSGEEALSIAKQEEIDIFILDIELPGINGLDLAREIRSLPHYALTLILFITGSEKNQLEAFKQFHCYDYILKPFGVNDFETKIITLIKQLSLAKHKVARIKMLLYPSKNKDLLIPIHQLKYAEVLHRRCYLYTDLQDAPFESSNITLKELLLEVDDPYFIQCHKAFAVNVKKIREIEQLNYRLWQITLLNTSNKLYVSNKYYGVVEKQFKEWIRQRKE